MYVHEGFKSTFFKLYFSIQTYPIIETFQHKIFPEMKIL